MTLFQNPVNVPNMKKIEGKVYNMAKEGKIVHYEVTPHYRGPNGEIPDYITIRATVEGRTVIEEKIPNRR